MNSFGIPVNQLIRVHTVRSARDVTISLQALKPEGNVKDIISGKLLPEDDEL